MEDLPVSVINTVAQSVGFIEELFGTSLTHAMYRAAKMPKAVGRSVV
jgi:hypothetical protein